MHKVNIPVWFACFSCRLYIGLIITYLLCIYLYVLYTFIGVFYEIIIIITCIIIIKYSPGGHITLPDNVRQDKITSYPRTTHELPQITKKKNLHSYNSRTSTNDKHQEIWGVFGRCLPADTIAEQYHVGQAFHPNLSVLRSFC